MTSTKNVVTSARNKMMDFLARRPYAENEMKQKLLEHFSPTEVEEALQFAIQKGWLASSSEQINDLSQQYAELLHKKGKGIEFINQYLQEKGLPPIQTDQRLELDKIHKLIQKKFPQFRISGHDTISNTEQTVDRLTEFNEACSVDDFGDNTRASQDTDYSDLPENGWDEEFDNTELAENDNLSPRLPQKMIKHHARQPSKNMKKNSKEQLQAKISRFLISRGFNIETVRKAVYDNSAE